MEVPADSSIHQNAKILSSEIAEEEMDVHAPSNSRGSEDAAKLSSEMLKQKLEWLLSRETILADAFLASNMSMDLQITLGALLRHPTVQNWNVTQSDIEEAVAQSSYIDWVVLESEVEDRIALHPNIDVRQTTIIIRQLPCDFLEEQVCELLLQSPHVQQREDIVSISKAVNETWFVVFKDAETAQKITLWLSLQKVEGTSVEVRLKANHFLGYLLLSNADGMFQANRWQQGVTKGNDQLGFDGAQYNVSEAYYRGNPYMYYPSVQYGWPMYSQRYSMNFLLNSEEFDGASNTSYASMHQPHHYEMDVKGTNKKFNNHSKGRFPSAYSQKRRDNRYEYATHNNQSVNGTATSTQPESKKYNNHKNNGHKRRTEGKNNNTNTQSSNSAPMGNTNRPGKAIAPKTVANGKHIKYQNGEEKQKSAAPEVMPKPIDRHNEFPSLAAATSVNIPKLKGHKSDSKKHNLAEIVRIYEEMRNKEFAQAQSEASLSSDAILSDASYEAEGVWNVKHKLNTEVF